MSFIYCPISFPFPVQASNKLAACSKVHGDREGSWPLFPSLTFVSLCASCQLNVSSLQGWNGCVQSRGKGVKGCVELVSCFLGLGGVRTPSQVLSTQAPHPSPWDLSLMDPSAASGRLWMVPPQPWGINEALPIEVTCPLSDCPLRLNPD